MNENEESVKHGTSDDADIAETLEYLRLHYKPYTYADLARDIAKLTLEQQAQVVCFCEPYDEADLLQGRGLFVAEADIDINRQDGTTIERGTVYLA